jgi:hypothetical protein
MLGWLPLFWTHPTQSRDFSKTPVVSNEFRLVNKDGETVGRLYTQFGGEGILELNSEDGKCKTEVRPNSLTMSYEGKDYLTITGSSVEQSLLLDGGKGSLIYAAVVGFKSRLKVMESNRKLLDLRGPKGSSSPLPVH